MLLLASLFRFSLARFSYSAGLNTFVAFTAGDKATFDCSIEGAPHCNVTWLRNNRPLDDRFADRVQMSESGKTHKLVIMNCRPEDSGQYTARASNGEGNVSCSAPLVVQTSNAHSCLTVPCHRLLTPSNDSTVNLTQT